MSNEFILVVSWKPMMTKYSTRLTAKQFDKIAPSISLQVVETLVELDWPHCMARVNVTEDSFIIGFKDNYIFWKPGQSLDSTERVACDSNLMSVIYYRGLAILIGFNEDIKIQNTKTGQIVWTAGLRIPPRFSSVYSSYSKKVMRFRDKIYLITDMFNDLVEIDLNVLIPRIEQGTATPHDYIKIGQNVTEMTVNPRNQDIYYLKDDGSFYLRKTRLGTCKHHDVTYTCIAAIDNSIIIGIEGHPGHTTHLACAVELYNHRGRLLDSIIDTADDRGRLPIRDVIVFTHRHVVMAMAVKCVAVVRLYAVFDKRLHGLNSGEGQELCFDQKLILKAMKVKGDGKFIILTQDSLISVKLCMGEK